MATAEDLKSSARKGLQVQILPSLPFLQKMKCECPKKGSATDFGSYAAEEWLGMVHKPGKCQGTYDIQLYRRGKKFLYLCSCCHIYGDIPALMEC